jgi:hypothetical protein
VKKMVERQQKINRFKYKNLPQNCPHQKTDNKGLINCIKGDDHIGLCQNPCPYKATASATMQNCTTFADKRFSGCFSGKKLEFCSIHVFFEVVQFFIEAEGDDCHA